MATDAYKSAGVNVEAGYESVKLIKDDVKRTAIEALLSYHKDFELFSEIELLPRCWEGTDSFIPAYQKQIDFLESLYPLMPGTEFLKHKQLVKEKVNILRRWIANEKKALILRHLNM